MARRAEIGERVTIKPQTFCYLKEIELKITEDTAKNPIVGNNYVIEINW